MRRFLLLAVAAATLATAAIATWGRGFADPRTAARSHQPASAAGNGRAPEASGPSTSPPMAIAAPRYRAEACSGDYVCRGGGAWEPVAVESAVLWALTGDGF
jgi:hypothetical protein